MRILVVTPRYPPSRGGLERGVGLLVRSLAQKGNQITVLSADRSARQEPADSGNGVRIIRYPSFHPFNAYYFSPRLARDYRAMARDFDVAQVHSLHALVAWEALRLRVNIPVVLNPHYHATGHTPLRRLLWEFAKPIGSKTLDVPRRIVCESALEARLLTGHFPRVRDRVVIIPGASAFDRPVEGKTRDPKRVLAVSRVERYKRLDLLVDAIALLPAEFNLTIVGTGPWMSGLTKKIQRDNLEDRVELFAEVTDEDLVRVFGRAGVFVSLSRHEAFGMAPLEAFRSGCNLVLPETTPLLESVPELRDASILLSPETTEPRVVAEAIKQAAAIGDVKRPVSSWDWQKIAAAYERIFREVVGTQGR